MTTSSRNRTPLLGAVAIALIALLVWQTRTPAPDPGLEAASDLQAVLPSGEAAGDGSPGASGRRDRRPPPDPAAKDAEAARYLQEQFGATITNKRSQIKALEKLIGYLMKAYPDDWQQRLKALLEQAFPGMGDQLYAQFLNMTAYNEWLEAHRAELNQMTSAERRDALREARFRHFGPDAAEIWEETFRNEQIYDAMDAINQTPDATVDEKLSSYLESIKGAYGEEAPSFIERRQTELMNNFLTLPTVQDDLHSMSAQARQQQLEQVRKAMGLDDDALARWRDLDVQRDRAWETGEQYMEERGEIVQKYQGDEQVRRLDELRKRTFGDEADIIRAEEDADFFRFGHRRVYGKE